MRHNYRILAKNEQGIFKPIEGIDHATKQPCFVTNAIHGLVLWNLNEVEKESRFDAIRKSYPEIEFDFRKA